MDIDSNKLWQLPAHWVIAAPLTLLARQEVLDIVEALLVDDERVRAGRFRKREDRQRYSLAHGLKRFVLSKILGVAPQSLVFSQGEKGKPFCDMAGAPQFNLSHSGDWVLCGLSSIADMGVDVESAEREISDAVARYSLNSEQLDKVSNADNPAECLMLYWTQKEAISKALGLGLSIGFKQLECSGEKLSSVASYNKHTLTLHSCLMNSYVISVAATTTNKPDFYSLRGWDQNGLWLRELLSEL